MKSTKTFEQIYKGLSAPVPFEFLQPLQKGRGPVLTTIQAGYITQTLNMVVGIGGWAFTRSEIQVYENNKCVEVTLYIADKHGQVASHTAFGGSRNPGPDGLKSAVTDGLTKAASYFGLGEEVFCGQVSADDIYAWQKDEAVREAEAIEEKAKKAAKKTTKKKTTKKSADEDRPVSENTVGKLVNLVKEHWEYESADVVLGFMARVKFKKNVWRSVTENEALQLIDSLQDDKKRKTVQKMVQEERQKNMDGVNANAKKAIEAMNGK